jgi:predicted amidohydrolase YtcJ
MEQLLSFYEDLNKRCPVGKRGWTIEHAALATPQQIDRIKALDLAVTTQTGLDYNLAAAWKKYWGDDRLNRSIPNRWLIDKGIQPGGGTDADTGPINTFLAMGADVTRETRAGLFGKDQAVTPLESLKMHTIWAANVTGDGGIKGSIEPGKLADLAVLDADPLMVDPEKIKDIRVMMTMVDGRIAFERRVQEERH